MLRPRSRLKFLVAACCTTQVVDRDVVEYGVQIEHMHKHRINTRSQEKGLVLTCREGGKNKGSRKQMKLQCKDDAVRNPQVDRCGRVDKRFLLCLLRLPTRNQFAVV